MLNYGGGPHHQARKRNYTRIRIENHITSKQLIKYLDVMIDAKLHVKQHIEYSSIHHDYASNKNDTESRRSTLTARLVGAILLYAVSV